MSSPAPIDLEKIRTQFFPFITSAGYTIKAVTDEEIRAFVKEKYETVFGPRGASGYFMIPPERAQKLGSLAAQYRLNHHENFLFFDSAGAPVGWQMSEAEDVITFYLRNAGVLPEHRNRGIYTEFSARLEAYLAQLGYERLTSHHQGTNRRILIRKLKDGFSLSGFELTERWGPLFKVVKILAGDRRENFYRNFGSVEHLK